MEFIDLKAQYQRLQPKIEARIRRVLEHGRYIMGPEVGELEEHLAGFVGSKHSVAVSSGTDALLIAMMALGIRSGDEVITTPFTFISSAETIALLGAKPVFVDIDPRTYNIDPQRIEAAITRRSRCIMPVSLYGQCADMDAINAIAARYGLTVIEDGAQSFGASYKNRKSCSLSTIGCTSFFPSKPLGAYGDAGACFTDDEVLAKKMREIRVHGQDRRYHHASIGLNGRLDTIQAAVLLAKLEIFPEEVAARARIGARYTEKLASIRDQVLDGQSPGRIVLPYVESWNKSVYAQYTIQAKGRDAVVEQLKKAAIPTSVHYPIPLHLQPAFASLGLAEGSLPQSEAVAKSVLSLPMHPYLDLEAQDNVVAQLRDAVTGTTTVDSFPDRSCC